MPPENRVLWLPRGRLMLFHPCPGHLTCPEHVIDLEWSCYTEHASPFFHASFYKDMHYGFIVLNNAY